MPPEVYKPDEWGRLDGKDKPQSELQKGNQLLKDLNDLAKTINTGLQTFSTIKGQMNPQMTNREPNIDAKVETRVNEHLTRMRESNPEAQTKAELKINSENATLDLLQRLHKFSEDNPDLSLKEGIELVKEFNTSGLLETQVLEWIKQFVEVKQ